MFKELNKGSIAGLLIVAVAGIITGILLLLGKAVPDLFIWLFFAGMAVVFVSSLFAKRAGKTKQDKDL